MSNKNIFLPHTHSSEEKITVTNVLDTIPPGSTETRLVDWDKRHSIEWRWRFVKFDKKQRVEISYLKKESPDRIYYNNKGEWVKRDVSTVFDKYVVKTFYYYS